MIDLTNPDAKKGALDALNILMKAKSKPIEVYGKKTSGGGGPQLAMPKNVHINNDDEDDDETQNQNGQGQGDGQTPQKQDGADKQNGKGKSGDGQGEQDENGESGESADGASSENGEQGQDKDGSASGNGASVDKIADDKNSGGEKTKPKFEMSDEEKAAMMDEIRQDKDFIDDAAAQEAKDAEEAKDRLLNGVKAADFSQLEDDLYYAIAAQVQESNDVDSTYERGGDPVYDDTGFIMPQDTYVEKKTKPLLYVFMDQSGSFGQAIVNRAKSVVKVLDEFVEDGKIAEPKYFVFADDVAELGSPEARYVGGGTSGWPECVQKIINSQNLPFDQRCTNVLVLSDDDIETQTRWNKKPCSGLTTIDGCVFWCWASNSRGRECEKHLIGEQGNFVYTF